MTSAEEKTRLRAEVGRLKALQQQLQHIQMAGKLQAGAAAQLEQKDATLKQQTLQEARAAQQTLGAKDEQVRQLRAVHAWGGGGAANPAALEPVLLVW